ncbi:MAG: aldo/keto reductase [Spirochaetaceae bacterium]|jgi:predicted aldo/keto reductase-like oxidoreductase|nr:aldo/keto reductase [Spirochaetaceae bacterium]
MKAKYIEAKLGRTNLVVHKDGFGALPIQRANFEDSGALLARALDGGINFIDTARAYSDSEEKIGRYISGRRQEYILATKTVALKAADFWKDIETSLGLLKTDHIDIYQFHNLPFAPKPGDESGLYDAALEAQKKGMIRFIGITNHRLPVAKEAVESGLYDTLQFPFSYLSSEKDIELVQLCAEKNVGFIAMKALSGGLLQDIGAARAWLAQYPNVVPIYGIQKMSELEQLIELMEATGDTVPQISPAQKAIIERDRKELIGNFCRACAYCMPCSVGIQLNWACRMDACLKRMPLPGLMTEYWLQEMNKIKDCTQCGLCKTRCPYGLDIPNIIPRNYRIYMEEYRRFHG